MRSSTSLLSRKATGVPTSVLRYYDDFGLISPVRRVGGKRRFDPQVIPSVRFIRMAQNAGFSLDDIMKLLETDNGGWAETVTHHLQDLRQRREQLDAIIGTLEDALDCGCDVVARCSKAGGVQVTGLDSERAGMTLAAGRTR